MKTLEQAIDSLIELDNTPKETMERYREIGEEVCKSESVKRIVDEFCDAAMLTGNVKAAMKYAFGQGVLTGIEMEKP